MQQVELLEGAGDLEPGPGPTPPRRRRRRWAVGSAAVAVLALAGTQWVVDHREDAVRARLAAVPGVVPPPGDSLEVVRTLSPDEGEALWTGIDLGAASASVVVAEDGSRALTATDTVSGGTVWSTPLLGPDAERAVPSSSSWGATCQGSAPSGRVSTFVACLVTDGFQRIDDDGAALVLPAPTASIEVLDPADGHVVVRWPVEAGSPLAVLADQLLVGHRDARGIEVVAHDPRTGDERWRYAEPLVPDPGASPGAAPERFWTFFAAGDVLAFSNGGALALLSSTGEKVRDDLRPGDGGRAFSTDPTTGDLVMTVYAGTDDHETTVLLSTDGDPGGDRMLDGRLLATVVDDGTVPGLVLTADGRLHAWDRATGRPRWTADVLPGDDALVVRGRVYVTTASSLVALDGRTGETDWETPADLGLGGPLATDGRHVLVPSTWGAADGGRLTAYDLATGAEVRRIPYPPGVTDVEAYEGLLMGWSDTSEEISVLD
ncbi:PQQ-binding-like beta-propeller repeat protein [Cellulomonas sp. ICMP 17802]|uniref:outer membrane protein assembly factor BamB family protein n=1 Tax=Cellulomonas sp. ICMP 17802 TaxID=3239199 RepID=UPI00351ACDAB